MECWFLRPGQVSLIHIEVVSSEMLEGTGKHGENYLSPCELTNFHKLGSTLIRSEDRQSEAL